MQNLKVGSLYQFFGSFIDINSPLGIDTKKGTIADSLWAPTGKNLNPLKLNPGGFLKTSACAPEHILQKPTS